MFQFEYAYSMAIHDTREQAQHFPENMHENMRGSDTNITHVKTTEHGEKILEYDTNPSKEDGPLCRGTSF